MTDGGTTLHFLAGFASGNRGSSAVEHRRRLTARIGSLFTGGLAAIAMVACTADVPTSAEQTNGGGAPSSPAVTSSASPTASEVVEEAPLAGLVALGHSAMTGENADPERPGEVLNEHSWATGTNPEVESIYLRMVAALPETDGNVANVGRGGAAVTDLPAQANTALFVVPTPRLVIIRAIDGDIRCDGTDDQNVEAFGEAMRQTLGIIHEKSPETAILVLGQAGRPADEVEMLEPHPDVRRSFGGTGMCDLFDPEGDPVPEAVETLTGILELYEGEQARVCAEVPRCWTDDGVMAAFARRAEHLTDDWNHVSIAGHAALAEHLWPTVAELLEDP